MGGGLMQLVAYGAQDIYLTGNPQITFFKVVYRRHTNFAIESIEQTYNGNLGSKISVTVSRNGDLLSGVWLDLSHGNAQANMYTLLDHVEVEIGGQVVDRQYSEWMQMWVDLTHDKDQTALLNDLKKASFVADNVTDPVNSTKTGSVPLLFWFCRNPGLALPLIALQYHEVKLNISFATAPEAATVWCEYVFLDTDERRRFAQVSHEYLIEQVQFSNKLAAKGESNQVELRFNHPVKELVWALGDNTTVGGSVQVKNALLQLNGHDRFKRRSGQYFTTQQRYQYHSGSSGNGNIHVYSFALKPEEHQPSGTCNFSRIDNAVLNFEVDTAADHTVRVYAVNYNVLRVMSGMGGLAYSN